MNASVGGRTLVATGARTALAVVTLLLPLASHVVGAQSARPAERATSTPDPTSTAAIARVLRSADALALREP